MKKRTKIISAIAGVVAFVSSILGIFAYFGITPYQSEPNLEVSFDMKPWGHFDGNSLSTGYRPASEDFNNNLIFSITNVGNSYAKDVNVHLQYYPHSAWLDLHNANVLVKNNDLTNVTIPTLVQGQTVTLNYAMTLSPAEYDKIVAAGGKPYIYYNVTASNSNQNKHEQFYFYLP